MSGDLLAAAGDGVPDNRTNDASASDAIRSVLFMARESNSPLRRTCRRSGMLAQCPARSPELRLEHPPPRAIRLGSEPARDLARLLLRPSQHHALEVRVESNAELVRDGERAPGRHRADGAHRRR